MNKLYVGAAIAVVSGCLAAGYYIKKRMNKVAPTQNETTVETEIYTQPEVKTQVNKEKTMHTTVTVGPAEAWPIVETADEETTESDTQILKWIPTGDGNVIGVGCMMSTDHVVGIMAKVKKQGAVRANDCTIFKLDSDIVFMNAVIDSEHNIYCLGSIFGHTLKESNGIIVKFDKDGNRINRSDVISNVRDFQYATITEDEIICVGNSGRDGIGVVTFDSQLCVTDVQITSTEKLQEH